MQPRTTFTIRENATSEETAGACKAVLIALWESLESLQVDLAGMEGDPDCAASLAALQPLRKRQLLSKKLDSVAQLEPGLDDDKLAAVLPRLSRTIGSTGLSRDDGRMVFNADDVGTSCVFELTSEQLEAVRDRLRGFGTRSDVLVSWHED